MNFAIKNGWAPALLAAVIAIILFMPADAVTEILTLVQTFLLTVIVLLVLSRVAPVAAWPRRRQTIVSWSVAVGAAVIVCLEPVVFSALKSIAAGRFDRAAASPFPGDLKIQEVFAKPLSQDAADEKFRGKVVFAVLHRPYLTWIAAGGITVNLDVPKKPNWYEGQGEVVEIEARGKIAEILFKEKHLTIECDPDDIQVRATE